MTVMNRGRTPSSIRPPRGINLTSRIKRQAAVGPQPRSIFGKTHPRVKNGPMDVGASKIHHYPDPRQEVRHGR